MHPRRCCAARAVALAAMVAIASAAPGIAVQATARPKAVARPKVTIIFGGDILLDLLPGERILEHGPAYPLEGIGEVRDLAQLGFANLESPVATGGEAIPGKAYTFRAHPETLAALRAGGIDVVSLANNHALDFGAAALTETMERLDGSGVKYAGAGRDAAAAYKPAILEVNGVKVGFLAFTDTFAVPPRHHGLWAAGEGKPGVALLTDQDAVVSAIEAAHPAADILVVSFHWGYEYLPHPAREQRALAHAAVEAGADIVVGHHPHVPQGVEVYRDRLIAYSLGNLVFHPYDERARQSMVLLATVSPGRALSARLYPVWADDGRAVLQDDDRGRQFLTALAHASSSLGTRTRLRGAYLQILLPAEPGWRVRRLLNERL